MHQVQRRMPNVRLHAALVINRPKRARRSFRRLIRFMGRTHFRHVNTFTCDRRRKACSFGRCASSVSPRIGRSHLSCLVHVRRNVSTRIGNSGVKGMFGIVVSQRRRSFCINHARFSSPRISPRVLISGRGLLVPKVFCGI